MTINEKTSFEDDQKRLTRRTALSFIFLPNSLLGTEISTCRSAVDGSGCCGFAGSVPPPLLMKTTLSKKLLQVIYDNFTRCQVPPCSFSIQLSVQVYFACFFQFAPPLFPRNAFFLSALCRPRWSSFLCLRHGARNKGNEFFHCIFPIFPLASGSLRDDAQPPLRIKF